MKPQHPSKLCSSHDDKWIKIKSQEGEEFRVNLAKILGASNSPSFCPACNCFLNNDKKKNHKKDHQKFILTAKSYTNWTDFCILLKNYNFVRGLEGDEEFKIPRPAPLTTQQEIPNLNNQPMPQPEATKGDQSLSDFIVKNQNRILDKDGLISIQNLKNQTIAKNDSENQRQSLEKSDAPAHESQPLSSPNWDKMMETFAKSFSTEIKKEFQEFKEDFREEVRKDIEV
jgi:hypothetical protein